MAVELVAASILALVRAAVVAPMAIVALPVYIYITIMYGGSLSFFLCNPPLSDML